MFFIVVSPALVCIEQQRILKLFFLHYGSSPWLRLSLPGYGWLPTSSLHGRSEWACCFITLPFLVRVCGKGMCARSKDISFLQKPCLHFLTSGGPACGRHQSGDCRPGVWPEEGETFVMDG